VLISQFISNIHAENYYSRVDLDQPIAKMSRMTSDTKCCMLKYRNACECHLIEDILCCKCAVKFHISMF